MHFPQLWQDYQALISFNIYPYLLEAVCLDPRIRIFPETHDHFFDSVPNFVEGRPRVPESD